MFGPLLAALVMRVFVSREGLQGSIGIRTSWRWYVIALAAPAALVLALILIDDWSGLGRLAWTRAAPFPLAYAGAVFVSGIVTTPLAIGEEYGWRGYLLPKLLPLGETRAILLVGIIWSAWHLPIIIIGLNYGGEPLWLALLLFALTTILLSFPFAWFYLASGSVLAVALMHATLNAATDTFVAPGYMPTIRPSLTGGGGIIMIGLLATLVLLDTFAKGRGMPWRSGTRGV
jgi:membrane protease YdiL (CAAX protease family)